MSLFNEVDDLCLRGSERKFLLMAYSSFSESSTKCCRTSKNVTTNNPIVNKVQNNRLLITGPPLRVLETMSVP